MARGKKYTDRQRTKVIEYLAANMSVADASKKTGIPPSTIRNWKNTTKECDPEKWAKLRRQKNEEFARAAWDDILRAEGLIGRKLQRAEQQEKAIDELIRMVEESEDESKDERRELIVKLKQIKVESMRDLTNAVGVLYDKQALASGEATEIHGGTVGIRKFEDM